MRCCWMWRIFRKETILRELNSETSKGDWQWNSENDYQRYESRGNIYSIRDSHQILTRRIYKNIVQSLNAENYKWVFLTKIVFLKNTLSLPLDLYLPISNLKDFKFNANSSAEFWNSKVTVKLLFSKNH